MSDHNDRIPTSPAEDLNDYVAEIRSGGCPSHLDSKPAMSESKELATNPVNVPVKQDWQTEHANRVRLIRETLDKAGVSFSFKLTSDEFTGTPDKDGHYGYARFEVTFKRDGREFTTTYFEGAGNRYYNGRLSGPRRQLGLKKGDTIRLFSYGPKSYDFRQLHQNGATSPNDPTIDGVLSCLVSDAQSVAYALCFEDWAHDMGEDPDSISLLKMYHACETIHASLVKLGLELETLSELFQDY